MAMKEKARSIWRKIKEGFEIYNDCPVNFFLVNRLI